MSDAPCKTRVAESLADCDDLRSTALPAGRPATGCVIKPAEQCLINESDEWRASNDDNADNDDPTLEIEVSREESESYDLDV